MTEVVIALALVGIALPAILGTILYLSDSSTSSRDLHEIDTIASSVELYLANGSSESGEDIVLGGNFSQVYQWVHAARQDDANAKVLFAYRPFIGDNDNNPSDEDATFITSSKEPQESEISRFDGRIMAIELHAADETILPNDAFPGTVASYEKAYLPMRLDIYAVANSEQPRDQTNFIESIPYVLKR